MLALSWRTAGFLGTATALALWYSLPDQKKVRLAQQWAALRLNLADTKDRTLLQARILSQQASWEERKKNTKFVCEGLGLVCSEYLSMTLGKAGLLLDELRFRMNRALLQGEKAYQLKKKELEQLSSSIKQR